MFFNFVDSQDHWSTYITEDDFAFMSANGLNAVRIPVGWWIASDPNPPAPFVGGSLQALDNAFRWAAYVHILHAYSSQTRTFFFVHIVLK
jgi:aryl-phospho-beta-D-glucosidase BglC (GH1 family)